MIMTPSEDVFLKVTLVLCICMPKVEHMRGHHIYLKKKER